MGMQLFAFLFRLNGGPEWSTWWRCSLNEPPRIPPETKCYETSIQTKFIVYAGRIWSATVWCGEDEFIHKLSLSEGRREMAAMTMRATQKDVEEQDKSDGINKIFMS